MLADCRATGNLLEWKSDWTRAVPSAKKWLDKDRSGGAGPGTSTWMLQHPGPLDSGCFGGACTLTEAVKSGWRALMSPYGGSSCYSGEPWYCTVDCLVGNLLSVGPVLCILWSGTFPIVLRGILLFLWMPILRLWGLRSCNW